MTARSTAATFVTATVLPLACWRLTTKLSIVDSVAELELVNFEAWGGHLTFALALDVHPGRLQPAVDALRPYAFPIVLLAMITTLALMALVTLALARLALVLLGPRDEDSAALGHLAHVSSSVARTQQLLSERQMELAALQSKAQHLEDEIRRAALDVDKRQRQLRSVEAQHAQLAEELGTSHITDGSPTTGSSSLAASSPPSETHTPIKVGTLHSSHASDNGPIAPTGTAVLGFDRQSPKRTDRPRLIGRSMAAELGSAAGVEGSGGLHGGATIAEEGWELSSPALDRFARLLGLSCGAADASRAAPHTSRM